MTASWPPRPKSCGRRRSALWQGRDAQTRGVAMNDMLQAAVLGILEGLTEFLPVSSPGHLLIVEHWLGKRSELFNVAIQAGAILAAVVVFWPRISQLLL